MAALALSIATVAGLTTSCQATPSQDPTDEVTTIQVTPSEEPTTDEPTTDESDSASGAAGFDDPRVAAAVEDLAEREDVATDAVVVGALEEVTWPNGAIGCPQDGMSYTQALVDGTRLILQIDGVEYAYHGEGDGPLSYCANPTDPVSAESM